MKRNLKCTWIHKKAQQVLGYARVGCALLCDFYIDSLGALCDREAEQSVLVGPLNTAWICA